MSQSHHVTTAVARIGPAEGLPAARIWPTYRWTSAALIREDQDCAGQAAPQPAPAKEARPL